MPGWTLVDTHPTQGRVFQRPLDVTELCFLWDGFFNGTADSSHHYELRLSNGAQDAHLFSEANIARAWVSTKRRFPLAGAIVRGADNAPLRVATDSKADDSSGFASVPHFVVREHDLAVLRPCDIVFGRVTDAEEAQQQAAAILQGPRLLSGESLVQLHVFRETGAERTDVLHLMILVAHCVTDGTATRTFARCLLDTLARGGGPEPGQVPLEERLAMAIPMVDLVPRHLSSLSPAIRRWRRAIATVIFRLRMKMTQGGHTLPCRLTRSTPYTVARLGVVSTSLTPAQTAVVIPSCRLHDITFGNTYLALAQVAMTRVLYRRYLRGEISEEEWTYRKRQPHISGGPLSLRRYLDKAWFENGGGGEFMLCGSLYTYQLPFMTLGSTAERHKCVLSDDAPPFPDLLSFDRFLHRTRLVKKQATALFNHPLFLEFTRAAYIDYIRVTRLRALRWMQHTETANVHDTHNEDEDKVLAVTDIPTIWAHGGSSLGNVDLISPSEYPLPPIHPLSPYCSTPHPAKVGYVTPPPPSDSNAETMAKIVVENLRVHLHTRPAELYLGANTSRGRMNMFVHYDGNVFQEEVVKEWLDESLWIEFIAPLDVKTRFKAPPAVQIYQSVRTKRFALSAQEFIYPRMLISKKNRRIIFENLFKEGVLVAKKDFNAPKHEDLDVPNLEVIKAMQSLTSKGLVKTQFSWQYYYYVLTPEGVEHLREWLHLPTEIVPATHKRAARPPRPATVRPGAGEGGGPRPPRGDQEGYRRKEGGAPGDYRPSFAGVGRGGP